MAEAKTRFGRGFCYPGSAERISERHVQAIWYDRDFRPECLFTRSGEELRVVHPGEWNLGPGPDFTGAVLELGPSRRRVRGDVEIHLSPSDWDAHSHGDDPAYANVVLHATWTRGPEPATLPAAASTVWLGRSFASSPCFSPEQIDVTVHPLSRLPSGDRPCFSRFGADPDLAGTLLSAAGEHRIRMKARRFAAALASRPGEREQVFYESAMEAFGYGRNAAGFRRVARSVPYASVVAEPANAEAAMLSAGGFVEWSRGGTRPWNSPEARLAAAARLFSSRRAMYLAEVASFAPSAVRAMVRLLTGGGLMGRGRAAAVVANVVLPFAVAEGRAGTFPEWLPPEDVSLPARTMAARMFGRDHNPCVFYASNGLRIQGLLQIYRDLCLRSHPDCVECPLARGAERGGTGKEGECSQDATAGR